MPLRKIGMLWDRWETFGWLGSGDRLGNIKKLEMWWDTGDKLQYMGPKSEKLASLSKKQPSN